MCIDKQRSFINCNANPPHQYYIVDWCEKAFISRKACETRMTENAERGIAASPGPNSCPYKGCSSDPKYQFLNPPFNSDFIPPIIEFRRFTVKRQ